MKTIIRSTLFVAMVLYSSTCIAQEIQGKEFPKLMGDYLGQKPPGMTPEVFASEITDYFSDAFGSVFSPDYNEFYFSTKHFDNEGDIVWMRKIDNVWTIPQRLNFNSDFCEYDMAISPDGFRMFFRSYRPLHGGTEAETNSPIWYAHRTDNGWSEAKPLLCNDKPLIAGYPSLSNSGTLFFPFRAVSNQKYFDLYFSRFLDGGFIAPKILGASFKTPYHEGDLCVAPDESYLIVSSQFRPDMNGQGDLYITFKNKNGSWSALKNMGSPVNGEGREGCPTITPDGKYLLFTGDSGFYWVDARVIDSLKPLGW